MNSIIEQIHHEASTAQQKLLKDAKQILFQSQDEKVVEQVEELKTLGFTSFKQARLFEPEELERIKELRDQIATYRDSFDYKFMTDDAVYELCKKFGLLQAPVNIYTDSIPMENQKDVINFSRDERVKPFLENLFMETLEVVEFKIKINGKSQSWDFAALLGEEKLTKRKAWTPIKTVLGKWDSYQKTEGWTTRGMTGILDSEGGKLNKKVLDKYCDMFLSNFKVLYKHGFITDADIEGYGRGEGAIAQQDLGIHPVLIESIARLKAGMAEKKIELRIIAPKHMLNLKGFEVNERFKAVPEGIRLAGPDVKEWFRDDDPIIQAKVKGGWLNVTAWGDEAELPGVQPD
ncbi:MAG: hypothetical protein P8J32_03485 [bacterium]|nr:hypothetical protein [bacterium]